MTCEETSTVSSPQSGNVRIWPPLECATKFVTNTKLESLLAGE